MPLQVFLPQEAGKKTLSIATRGERIGSTFTDASLAHMGSNFKNTIINTIWRTADLNAAMRGEEIAELDWRNSPFFRKELQFIPGMTWEYASIISKHQDIDNERRDIIERGPKGFLGLAAAGIGILGGVPDPINFIPVIGQSRSLRMIAGVSRASRGLFTTAVSRKAFSRLAGNALIGGTDALITEAVFQPAFFFGQELRQQPFDNRQMFINLGMAFGIGSTFGSIGGVVGRFRYDSRIRALRKASGDIIEGRPIDVRAEFEPETRKISVEKGKEVIRADSVSVQPERVAHDLFRKALDEARPRIIPDEVLAFSLEAIPITPKIRQAMTKVLSEIQGESVTARYLLDDFDFAIREAVLDSPSGKWVKPADVIDPVGTQRFDKPSFEKMAEFEINEIRESSDAIADSMTSRIQSMADELTESQAPLLTKIEGKFKRSRSTRPKWMQGLRNARLVENYAELQDVFQAILTGNEKTLRRGLKRAITETKKQAMRDIAQGFDAADAPIHALNQGGAFADPLVVRELQRLDGQGAEPTPLDMATQKPEVFPDDPDIKAAELQVDKGPSMNRVTDDVILDEQVKITDEANERLQNLADDNQLDEGSLKFLDEIKEADAELKLAERQEELYDFFANCSKRLP